MLKNGSDGARLKASALTAVVVCVLAVMGVLLTAPASACAQTVDVANETELRNAMSSGADTVNLTADVALTSSLEIPSGTSLTVTGDHAITAAANGSFTLGKAPSVPSDVAAAVVVDDGATLVLGGSAVLDGTGAPDDVRALTDYGSVVIDGGTIQHWSMMSYSVRYGILVDGADASLAIEAGGIQNNTFDVQNNGALLYVDRGAKMTMTGGSISDNTLSWFDTLPTNDPAPQDPIVQIGVSTYDNSSYAGKPSAPCEDAGATFEFTGGSISGNKAGSTVFVGQYMSALGKSFEYLEETWTNHASMTMSGSATISDNQGSAGSGVNVWGCGAFEMDGGTIDGNSSWGFGGGVVALDGYTTGDSQGTGRHQRYYRDVSIDEWSQDHPASFTMNGGTISNNSATETRDGLGCGGGVYTWPPTRRT